MFVRLCYYALIKCLVCNHLLNTQALMGCCLKRQKPEAWKAAAQRTNNKKANRLSMKHFFASVNYIM